VTLQTLDHRSFDHGQILAQTEPPGIEIPPHCSYDELLQMVTPKASEILMNGLRDRLFLPPIVDVGRYDQKPLKIAPKITSEDRRINWLNWNATTILRQSRALGRAWTILEDINGKKLRVAFEDVQEVTDLKQLLDQNSLTVEDDPTGHATGDLSQMMESYIGRDLTAKDDIKGREEEKALSPMPRCVAISTGDLETNVKCFIREDAIVFIDRNEDAISIDRITVEGKPTQCARRAMYPFIKQCNVM
jgi:hypothetical protein